MSTVARRGPAEHHQVRAEVPFSEDGDTSPAAEHRQRRRDKIAQRAYDAGRRGRPFSIDANSDVPVAELRDHYRTGTQHREQELRDEYEQEQETPRTQELPATGSAPSAPAPAAPSSSSSAPAGGGFRFPRPSLAVSDGAGFLLGLFLYAMVLNFIRGGPDAVKGWLAAKFLNRPHAPAGATPATPAAPSSPSPPAGPDGSIMVFPAAPDASGVIPAAPAQPDGAAAANVNDNLVRYIAPAGTYPGRLPAPAAPATAPTRSAGTLAGKLAATQSAPRPTTSVRGALR